ncbi:glycosyltransferase [Rothia sp. ZJ932]|nr:glycosyltransferase [Rothia sp. ZJ932]
MYRLYSLTFTSSFFTKDSSSAAVGKVGRVISRNLHLISMHTSPLSQPGDGDAGGMNVYIASSMKAVLARYSELTLEVFTLDTAKDSPGYRRIDDGPRCTVHVLSLDQARGARKEELPAYIAAFAAEIKARALAPADVVHSHYWLSGMAVRQYAPDVPWIHTMHTTAAVKNAHAGAGEPLESQERFNGEQRIINDCSALVVNTPLEAQQMVEHYGAAHQKLHVIRPGVDTDIFYPEPKTNHSPTQAQLLFAGRPQPLKGPHIIIEALALLPESLAVTLTMVGKSHSNYEQQLIDRAHQLGIENQVTVLPAMVASDLAQTMRQADIVLCPSSSETFGLVALEAQATGTPVIATDVDGLTDAVKDEETGVLVADRSPAAWAQAIEQLVQDPKKRQRLGRAGANRSVSMSWSAAADKTVKLYNDLLTSRPLND